MIGHMTPSIPLHCSTSHGNVGRHASSPDHHYPYIVCTYHILYIKVILSYIYIYMSYIYILSYIYMSYIYILLYYIILYYFILYYIILYYHIYWGIWHAIWKRSMNLNSPWRFCLGSKICQIAAAYQWMEAEPCFLVTPAAPHGR